MAVRVIELGKAPGAPARGNGAVSPAAANPTAVAGAAPATAPAPIAGGANPCAVSLADNRTPARPGKP